MIKLINKGGFRERANRSQRYGQSENRLTTLEQRRYAREEYSREIDTQTENQTLSPNSSTTTESTPTTTLQQTT